MHIGVIGVRSKHLRFFQEALLRCYPSAEHTISHVCGYDAPELLPSLTDFTLCDTPAQLIEAVDAVIIALREGHQHAALARMCMEAGKPVFVDKPFTCDISQARELLEVSLRTGIPCTGGSTVCFTEKARQLKAELPCCKEYSISYMADPFDPFGGWYFYGSHLTDLCVSIFGRDWSGVSAEIQGDRITARVRYPRFSVVLRTSPEMQPLLITADREYQLDDHGCYAAGMMHFCNVASGREECCTEDLVSSVALLRGILAACREP